MTLSTLPQGNHRANGWHEPRGRPALGPFLLGVIEEILAANTGSSIRRYAVPHRRHSANSVPLS